MKVLIACKAAYFTAGDAGYWDVFDALQNALFVENRNIEEQGVIDDCIRDSGIGFAKWVQHYNSGETKDAVEKDFLLAKQYGVHGVPCLIRDGKYRISGAQPLAQIIQAIRNAMETQEQPPLANSLAVFFLTALVLEQYNLPCRQWQYAMWNPLAEVI